MPAGEAVKSGGGVRVRTAASATGWRTRGSGRLRQPYDESPARGGEFTRTVGTPTG